MHDIQRLAGFKAAFKTACRCFKVFDVFCSNIQKNKPKPYPYGPLPDNTRNNTTCWFKPLLLIIISFSFISLALSPCLPLYLSPPLSVSRPQRERGRLRRTRRPKENKGRRRRRRRRAATMRRPRTAMTETTKGWRSTTCLMRAGRGEEGGRLRRAQGRLHV